MWNFVPNCKIKIWVQTLDTSGIPDYFGVAQILHPPILQPTEDWYQRIAIPITAIGLVGPDNVVPIEPLESFVKLHDDASNKDIGTWTIKDVSPSTTVNAGNYNIDAIFLGCSSLGERAFIINPEILTADNILEGLTDDTGDILTQ